MSVSMNRVCCRLAALLLPCVLSPPHADARSWEEQIALAALEELNESGVPSLQIAVGHDGKVIFEGAYGLADVENDVPATPKTRYRTASVTKWMTATATMGLVEKRKLDLDGPVQAYCPQFPEKRWPVTTRQLLTHTSGIRHYADYDSALAEAKTDAELAEIERRRDRSRLGEYTRYTDVIAPLENFKDDPLVFEPGSGWLYTSFGYRVLACVLEGAAGRSYREIMTREVFDRAGMADIVDDDAWAIIPRRAAGYRLVSGEPLRRADMRDVSENLPAGGHLATASDLVSFALAFHAHRVVSADTVLLMSRPLGERDGREADSSSWRDAIPSEGKYGYGVMFFPTDDDPWLGHSGQQAGGSAIVMLAPDRNLSFAVMTNVKGWRGYISFSNTLRAILDGGLSQTP